jgi:hypothetical protein
MSKSPTCLICSPTWDRNIRHATLGLQRDDEASAALHWVSNLMAKYPSSCIGSPTFLRHYPPASSGLQLSYDIIRLPHGVSNFPTIYPPASSGLQLSNATSELPHRVSDIQPTDIRPATKISNFDENSRPSRNLLKGREKSDPPRLATSVGAGYPSRQIIKVGTSLFTSAVLRC